METGGSGGDVRETNYVTLGSSLTCLGFGVLCFTEIILEDHTGRVPNSQGCSEIKNGATRSVIMLSKWCVSV